jgi:hypothetical protein
MTSRRMRPLSMIAFEESLAPSCRPRRHGKMVPGLNLVLNYSRNGWRMAAHLELTEISEDAGCGCYLTDPGRRRVGHRRKATNERHFLSSDARSHPASSAPAA